jgi:hypothetical protein
MIRNFKAMGLVAVAVLALSATAASGASAAEKFHSSIENTFVHAEQEGTNVFTVNSRTVTCTTATFSGESKGKETAAGVFSTTTLTVHPKYENCTAFGLPATVTTEGCNYEFLEPAGTTPTLTGNLNLVCETGKSIIINVNSGTCTVTVGTQNGLSSVSYTTETVGGHEQVKVAANVTNITANVAGGILTCGTNGARPSTYVGNVITKGFTNSGLGTQVNVSVM